MGKNTNHVVVAVSDFELLNKDVRYLDGNSLGKITFVNVLENIFVIFIIEHDICSIYRVIFADIFLFFIVENIIFGHTNVVGLPIHNFKV